jgi:hypothetical protein
MVLSSPKTFRGMGMPSEAKRLAMLRFEAGRAIRTAHQVAAGDIGDTQQAVRDLARCVAALAQAVEDLLDRQEQDVSASV